MRYIRLREQIFRSFDEFMPTLIYLCVSTIPLAYLSKSIVLPSIYFAGAYTYVFNERLHSIFKRDKSLFGIDEDTKFEQMLAIRKREVLAGVLKQTGNPFLNNDLRKLNELLGQQIIS